MVNQICFLGSCFVGEVAAPEITLKHVTVTWCQDLGLWLNWLEFGRPRISGFGFGFFWPGVGSKFLSCVRCPRVGCLNRLGCSPCILGLSGWLFRRSCPRVCFWSSICLTFINSLTEWANRIIPWVLNWFLRCTLPLILDDRLSCGTLRAPRITCFLLYCILGSPLIWFHLNHCVSPLLSHLRRSTPCFLRFKLWSFAWLSPRVTWALNLCRLTITPRLNRLFTNVFLISGVKPIWFCPSILVLGFASTCTPAVSLIKLIILAPFGCLWSLSFIWCWPPRVIWRLSSRHGLAPLIWSWRWFICYLFNARIVAPATRIWELARLRLKLMWPLIWFRHRHSLGPLIWFIKTNRFAFDLGSPLILSFLNALIRCSPSLIILTCLGLIVWVVICLILGRTPRVFWRYANRSCFAPLIRRWLLHWMIRAGILRAPFLWILWFTSWSLKLWWP